MSQKRAVAFLIVLPLLISCGKEGAKSASAASAVLPPATEEELTEETLARMQDASADGERLERRASTLARNIGQPLLGELQALLRDGRKITAIKRYREVSGEGLRVAKSVIDLLTGESESAEQPR